MRARLTALAVATMVVGSLAAMPAQADYLFSGAGGSGNLFPGVEPWSFNFTGSPNWGSPGVGAGTTLYSHLDAAYGFDISFTGGGTIMPGSIEIGNGASCDGNLEGGTTFCTLGPENIWIATQTGPSSIAFRAQSESFDIVQGQSYFVNVLFADDITPTGFEGRWLTDFSPTVDTPEPASMALLGLGLAGLGVVRRRR